MTAITTHDASHEPMANVDRITGIDAMRFVALIGLFFIHAPLMMHSSSNNFLSTLADGIFRFGVPFFFIASGYFLSRAPTNIYVASARSLKRVLIPFLFWAFVYVILNHPPLRQAINPKYILNLAIGKISPYHLWFLPSLALCTVMLLVVRNIRWSMIFSMAGILYLIGLAFGAYYGPLTGKTHFFWNTRTGPFFGLLFMVAGLYFADKKIRPPLWFGLSLFAVGGAMQLFEYHFLQNAHFDSAQDQLFGTIPFGIGAFFIALRMPDVKVTQWSAKFGRYSMGIYASHYMVLFAVIYMIPIKTFPSEILDIVIALTITTTGCVWLSKLPYARPLFR